MGQYGFFRFLYIHHSTTGLINPVYTELMVILTCCLQQVSMKLQEFYYIRFLPGFQ